MRGLCRRRIHCGQTDAPTFGTQYCRHRSVGFNIIMPWIIYHALELEDACTVGWVLILLGVPPTRMEIRVLHRLFETWWPY